MKNRIHDRINALRAEMHKLNLDAWYISGTDPHSSEYLPDRWQTRTFISGFTGSYGMVVVTQNEAALWTDTRYFIQAEEQLEGTGIEMIKLRVPDAISPEQWLNEKLSSGSRVGMDTQTVSVAGFRNFQLLLRKKNIELVETADLLEAIWPERPLNAPHKVFELDAEYAGRSRKDKQSDVAAAIEKSGADYHIVSMLDELAWLYNLRGSDINFNPVFTGFGIVGKEESFLFVENHKFDLDLAQKLTLDGVIIKEYSEFYSFLTEITGKKLFIDPSSLNYAAYSKLKEKNEFVETTSALSLLKARKNETELNGFRAAMKKDGVALLEFLHWLNATIGNEEVTEFEIGVKLKEFRARQKGFKGESFPPIVGYKEHGAIVHLSVDADAALPVEAEGILLFDSGGQYFDGTTDITRTIALGEITEQQKIDYTLVLKGMIGLSCASFPYGTKGCHVDILARQHLWSKGMNYGHGTGHGVGHFLNVHEGPMAIRQELNENLVEPGHVMSNEPAFYREGMYGIRTENMMVCVEKETTEFGQFLAFETLTLCPIDTSLIEKELMTGEELSWLNAYHQKVNMELKPLLHQKYHDLLDELTEAI